MQQPARECAECTCSNLKSGLGQRVPLLCPRPSLLVRWSDQVLILTDAQHLQPTGIRCSLLELTDNDCPGAIKDQERRFRQAGKQASNSCGFWPWYLRWPRIAGRVSASGRFWVPVRLGCSSCLPSKFSDVVFRLVSCALNIRRTKAANRLMEKEKKKDYATTKTTDRMGRGGSCLYLVYCSSRSWDG